jgi:hypothetical protein
MYFIAAFFPPSPPLQSRQCFVSLFRSVSFYTLIYMWSAVYLYDYVMNTRCSANHSPGSFPNLHTGRVVSRYATRFCDRTIGFGD